MTDVDDWQDRFTYDNVRVPRNHVCAPPRYRPKHEWRTIRPPLAFMKPERRKNAKPWRVPTQYPPGTVWRCECGRGWYTAAAPPPRHGHRPTGLVVWRPVRWYHRRLRARLAAL